MERPTPVIVSEPARKLVGLEYVGLPGGNDIPQLWQRFMPRMGEVKRIKDTYGYARAAEPGSKEVRYLVGSEVADFSNLPDGMVGREVAGGPYASLTCPSLDALSDTMRWFYEEWLPASDYVGGEGALEYYPPTFPGVPSFEMRFKVEPR